MPVNGKKEGLPKVKDFIGEPFDTNVEIVENGVHYMVDVANGQKTGFFLDQKYNRLAMQRICKGKRFWTVSPTWEPLHSTRESPELWT